MIQAEAYGYTTVYATIDKTEKEAITELKRRGFKPVKSGSPIEREKDKVALVFENRTLKEFLGIK